MNRDFSIRPLAIWRAGLEVVIDDICLWLSDPTDTQKRRDGSRWRKEAKASVTSLLSYSFVHSFIHSHGGGGGAVITKS